MFITDAVCECRSSKFICSPIRQMMPTLCDDVLLDIFAHLDIQQLYSVSQCSRRFEALAQQTFDRALDGRLELKGYDFQLRNFESDDNRLRVFGKYAKHIKYFLPFTTRKLQWPMLDISRLQSMSIDVTQIRSLCRQKICFEQITDLKLHSDTHSAVCNINFGQCFPKLTSLVLGTYIGAGIDAKKDNCPRNLQSLTLESRSHLHGAKRIRAFLQRSPGLRHLKLFKPPMPIHELIDLMVECGIHL